MAADRILQHPVSKSKNIWKRKMAGDKWTETETAMVLELWINGESVEQVAAKVGRAKAAVYKRGTWIGLFALSQYELKAPGVAIRECLNESEPHSFVSLHAGNRRCPRCKQSAFYRAA